jgi:hypothetical protein
MPKECGPQGLADRDRPPTRLRLRFDHSLESIPGPLDPQNVPLEVDVLPAEGAQLAEAQARVEGGRVDHPIRLLESGEELLRLGRRCDPVAASLNGG